MTTEPRQPSPRREILISLLLVLVTFAVYWPVRQYEFVNYDDPDYVSGNSFVLRGFSWDGIVWAFGRLAGERTYWHPVTWLSHMLDCQLFGTDAGAHHLVNVGFHAANVVLLFLVLQRMTGAGWRSAVVAALFAWHPLQVDSVAWVTERKNVLSTCLGLLTLLAYVRYVRRPGVGRYGLVMVCFGLGLMAKPMWVTMPLILLLLDFWPLQRFQLSTLDAQASTFFRLVVEKLPLLTLSAASAAITVVGHAQLKSLSAAGELPMGARLANALVSYVRYLGKMIWPVDLAVFYPYPKAWPAWAVIGTGLWVAGATIVVIWLARRRPYLAVGWLWYVITLVPVIGLVQAGSQAMADRFIYAPLIGLLIMLVWLVADLKPTWPHRVRAQWFITVVALAACLAATHLQLRYWRDSESLWLHALSCTSGNYIAHNNLGAALVEQGRVNEAITHFQAAIEIKPNYAGAHNKLGVVLFETGQTNEAIAHWQQAIGINPRGGEARNNLGNALATTGRMDEAIAVLQRAVEINPDDAAAHNNLGLALLKTGRMNEAIAHWQKAVEINPTHADAHNNLGGAFFKTGRMDEAIAHWQKAVEINFNHAEAHHNLGLAFFKTGRTDAAIAQYKKAVAINPNYAEAHNNLGKAFVQIGRMDEAMAHWQRAIEINPQFIAARNNLARVLATGPVVALRNGVRAIALAEQSNQLAGGRNPELLGTLAAAYAEAGRFSNAVITAQPALQLAIEQANQVLADKLRKEIGLYESGLPCRDHNPMVAPDPKNQ